MLRELPYKPTQRPQSTQRTQRFLCVDLGFDERSHEINNIRTSPLRPLRWLVR
jgi:hypothetical protein